MSTLPQFISQEDWDSHRQRIKLETGITISFVEMGNPDGPVLFLQHGMCDNSRAWSLAAPYFAKEGYHIYLLDLRGMGYSEEPDGFYTPIVYANDIHAFVKSKGIDKFYYVGHSLGSFIGQALMAMYPESLKKVVLVATGVLNEKSQGTLMYQMSIGLKENQHPSDKFIDLWYGGLEHIDQDFVSRMKKEAQQLPAKAWVNISGGMVATNFSTLYPYISRKVPLLMLFGLEDNMLGKDMREGIKEIFNNAEYIDYEGIGHNIQYEIPEKLANDVIKFLKK